MSLSAVNHTNDAGANELQILAMLKRLEQQETLVF
jgi:hypothetical protein